MAEAPGANINNASMNQSRGTHNTQPNTQTDLQNQVWELKQTTENLKKMVNLQKGVILHQEDEIAHIKKQTLELIKDRNRYDVLVHNLPERHNENTLQVVRNALADHNLQNRINAL